MSEITVLQLLHGMSVGGAEILAAGLARRLRGQFRFVFACLDHVGELGEELKGEGFPLVVLDRESGVDWRCSQALKREVSTNQVTLIHAHQYTPFFYALTTGILRRRPPVLFTEHGRFHPDLPNKKHFLFNRTLLRKTDRVIGVGKDVRRALIENEGIPEDRVDVIYNGIDLSRFQQPPPDSAKRIRRSLGIDEDCFVVTLVGRLNDLKDHSTAIRTAQRVAAEHPNFRMLFIGGGEEQQKIVAEIKERKLEESVTLLGTRHDVPDILHASDVNFLSSISEGIPLTLIEGMAASLPTVSTNVGGIAEVVNDGETGLLAPAQDDEALAKHLLDVARNSELGNRLGKQGCERALECFSEVEMHRRYAELYREIAGVI